VTGLSKKKVLAALRARVRVASQKITPSPYPSPQWGEGTAPLSLKGRGVRGEGWIKHFKVAL